jgi:formylmethanofuran:tetrahydromethanopterin formyltransferase
MARQRRRTYNLLYYLGFAGNQCSDFRAFVLECAQSGGRELKHNAPDSSDGRCGIALKIICATTGSATAEKLSYRIRGRYDKVMIESSRDYTAMSVNHH